MTRFEAAVGTFLLDLIRWYQLRKLSVRVRRFEGDDGRVTPWLDLGDPKAGTIVWIHGFSDRPEGFLRTADHLAQDYRIVAPAVPAFHDGWRDPNAHYTIGAFADWLRPVIESAVPEPHILVGNSLGGAVCLELASRRPSELRGLIAVNSAGMSLDGVECVADEIQRGDNPFEIRQRRQVSELFSRIVGRSVRIPGPVEAALFKEYADEADWYVRLGREIGGSEPKLSREGYRAAADLSAIGSPALVLWGVNDTLFPRAHAERMAEVIPDGRLEWLEGIGHSPHIERPKVLAKAIRRFAESLQ